MLEVGRATANRVAIGLLKKNVERHNLMEKTTIRLRFGDAECALLQALRDLRRLALSGRRQADMCQLLQRSIQNKMINWPRRLV